MSEIKGSEMIIKPPEVQDALWRIFIVCNVDQCGGNSLNFTRDITVEEDAIPSGQIDYFLWHRFEDGYDVLVGALKHTQYTLALCNLYNDTPANKNLMSILDDLDIIRKYEGSI